MSVRPFSTRLDMKTGQLTPRDRIHIRKLTDRKGMFLDTKTELLLLEKENPVIYSFQERILPEENGHLQIAVTTIHPRKIGDEYFMTKAHYHKRPDTSEAYLGLEGQGYFLAQTLEGDFESIVIKPGVLAYIPPGGHRMVNTGSTPFIFFAAYPGDAGHNYGDIERTGFVKILIEKGGKPLLMDNPRWKKAG
jgi:glucose-6-phosphate isomerase